RKLVRLDVVVEDAHRTLVRDQERREHADERRFARAIRAEQPIDLAATNAQRHAIDRAARRFLCLEGLADGGGHERVARGHHVGLSWSGRDLHGHFTLLRHLPPETKRPWALPTAGGQGARAVPRPSEKWAGCAARDPRCLE